MSDASETGHEFPAVPGIEYDDPAKWTPTIQVAEAVVVNPGDRVLIRVDPATPAEDVARFKSALRQHFPGSMVVIVAAHDMAVVRAAALDDPARPLVDTRDAHAATVDDVPRGGPAPSFNLGPLPDDAVEVTR